MKSFVRSCHWQPRPGRSADGPLRRVQLLLLTLQLLQFQQLLAAAPGSAYLEEEVPAWAAANSARQLLTQHGSC